MALGKKTGGRKKGVPNKTTATVKAALEEAFDKLGGVRSLTEWAGQNPNDFYRLWIKLLPQEMKVVVDMDDRLQQEVRDRLHEIDSGDAGFTGETGCPEPEDMEHATPPEGDQPAPGETGDWETPAS